MSESEPEWMLRKEVAEKIRTPEETLAQWAHRGIGPPYVRAGRKTIYRRSDLERWLQARQVGGEPVGSGRS